IRLQSSKTNGAQRSINLTISSRGIAALHAVDPEMATHFLDTAIPMRGRMIHDENGKVESQLYDPHGGQCLNSVARGIVNEQLLDKATAHPFITVFFQHKLVAVDFHARVATFSIPQSTDGGILVQTQINASFDLCIGADGSYSN
ncbi:kynurenine 3-monooxygenase, mitochondrial precursor, partial [Tulasnella sp. 403]